MTHDQGSSWLKHCEPLTLTSVTFTDALNGWMVGNTARAPGAETEGRVLKTVDGGATWTNVVLEVTRDDHWFLSDVLANTPEDVWLVGDVLQHTIDGGRTWITPTGLDQVLLDLRNDSINMNASGFAWISRAPAENFLYSSDRGTTWATQPLPRHLRGSNALDFRDGRVGIALQGQPFVTLDGGTSWSLLWQWLQLGLAQSAPQLIPEQAEAPTADPGTMAESETFLDAQFLPETSAWVLLSDSALYSVPLSQLRETNTRNKK